MKTVSWVRASLFACAVLAHAPHLFAQASTPEVAAPKAAPTVIPPPTEATEPQAAEAPAEPTAAAAEPALTAEDEANEAPPAQKYDVGTSRLEDKLHKVEAERDRYSRLAPWLTVGVGAAMTLGGTAVGAGYVYGCNGDCATPFWIGVLVAAGTLVATVGTIWVVHANADVRELDSKRYQLEQELDRMKFTANLPNKSELQRSQFLSMRFAFR